MFWYYDRWILAVLIDELKGEIVVDCENCQRLIKSLGESLDREIERITYLIFCLLALIFSVMVHLYFIVF